MEGLQRLNDDDECTMYLILIGRFGYAFQRNISIVWRFSLLALA